MIIRRKALLFVLTAAGALLLCGNLAAQNKKNAETFTVVLDAGHGGEDPGAPYAGVKEKDVNLAVALKLGKLISDNCPDVKVVYTRKTDVFIKLDERGMIANRAGANLFISLHADAIDGKPSANGASTYIMGVDKTENNLREAMRENAVMKYEDDYMEKYEGFDPTSPESYIIFSLMQYAYFDRSLQFANIIQKHYAKNTSFTNRGAKQGPFYVLWKPAMPSVLTEMGFVTNENDRRYMTSEKGQEAIAKSIFEAFLEYREATDKKGGETDQAKTPAVAETKPADTAPVRNKPAEQKPAEQKPVQVTPTVKPAETAPVQAKPADTPKAASGTGFYVQLCASRTKISAGDSKFSAYRDRLVEKQVDGWYKYYIGGYTVLEDAVQVRDEVKKGNFKDAFVIALDGDKQITIEEARRRIAANDQ